MEMGRNKEASKHTQCVCEAVSPKPAHKYSGLVLISTQQHRNITSKSLLLAPAKDKGGRGRGEEGGEEEVVRERERWRGGRKKGRGVKSGEKGRGEKEQGEE